jgi:predicted PurR-regulated permease PerM
MAPDNDSRIYRLAFFIAAVLCVGFVSFRVLKPFLAAIAWAVVLVVGFRAPWTALERRLANRRGLAAGLMASVIALVVLLPAGLFAGLLLGQVIEAGNKVNDALQSHHVDSLADIVALPWLSEFLREAETRFGVTPEDVQRLVGGVATRASTIIAGLSTQLALGVFDAIVTFVTTIFLLFFFFRDGASLGRAAIELMPTDEAGRSAMTRSFRELIGAIFRGSLLCALVQGLTGAIGWWLSGLGSPALAGAAMSILSLVPLGGTALVWIPGSVWLWWTGHATAALFLFLWCSLITTFAADNLLRPFLIGSSEQLSTLVVFLGVFGGLAAFGLLGIFIGPVALVAAKVVLDVMRREAGTAASPGTP